MIFPNKYFHNMTSKARPIIDFFTRATEASEQTVEYNGSHWYVNPDHLIINAKSFKSPFGVTVSIGFKNDKFSMMPLTYQIRDLTMRKEPCGTYSGNPTCKMGFDGTNLTLVKKLYEAACTRINTFFSVPNNAKKYELKVGPDGVKFTFKTAHTTHEETGNQYFNVGIPFFSKPPSEKEQQYLLRPLTADEISDHPIKTTSLVKFGGVTILEYDLLLAHIKMKKANMMDADPEMVKDIQDMYKRLYTWENLNKYMPENTEIKKLDASMSLFFKGNGTPLDKVVLHEAHVRATANTIAYKRGSSEGFDYLIDEEDLQQTADDEF